MPARVIFATALLAFIPELSPGDPPSSQPQADGAYEVEVLGRVQVAADQRSILKFVAAQSPQQLEPAAIESMCAKLGDPKFAVREAAERDLVRCGPAAAEALRKLTGNAPAEVARRVRSILARISASRSPEVVAALTAAVRLLASSRNPASVEALLNLLPHAGDDGLEEEIWFALDATAKSLGAFSPRPDWFTDPQPSRRAAAGFLAARRGPREWREKALALLHDPDPIVRYRVAQGMVGSADERAIPVLIALLESLPVRYAWQAEELLRWVAWADSPDELVGVGDLSARSKCRKAWEGWWARAGRSVRLASVFREPRRPILFFNGASLIGGDGTVRWTHPFARASLEVVQLLPNDRVLALATRELRTVNAAGVAVVYKPGVWECGLDGVPVWVYESPPAWVAQPPAVARRLADGRTVVAGLDATVVIPPGEQSGEAAPYAVAGAENGRRFFRPQSLRDGRLFGLIAEHHDQSNRFVSIAVAELDCRTGRELWRSPIPELAGLADATARVDGTMLVSHGIGAAVLIDRAGTKIRSWPGGSQPVFLTRNGGEVRYERGRRRFLWREGGRTVHEGYVSWTWEPRSWPVAQTVALGLADAFAPGADLSDNLTARVEALGGRNECIRWLAASALRQDFGPSAARAALKLLEALADELALRRDRTVPRPGAAEECARTLAALGPAGRSAAFRGCESPRPEVRAAAIQTLHAMRWADPAADRLGAWEQVKRACNDGDALVRRTALMAVLAFPEGSDAALDILIVALADPDRTSGPHGAPSVAGVAAGQVGTLVANSPRPFELAASRRTLAALLPATRGPDPRLAFSAASALGALMKADARLGSEVVAAFRENLGPRGNDASRWGTLCAIRPGCEELAPLVVAILASRPADIRLRCAAICACGSLGAAASAAQGQLARIAERGADPDERREVLSALRKTGLSDPEAVQRVKKIAESDSDLQIQSLAKEVLRASMKKQ